MGVRTVVGFTSSVSTLRRPNSKICAVVQLVRRWRFTPRAEARSQFSQAANGGRFTPCRCHFAASPTGVGYRREQSRLQSAPALRHGAAPTSATHHWRHRRRGAHAFRVWAAFLCAEVGPSVHGHEPVVHLTLFSMPWRAKVSRTSCRVQPNPSLKRSANGRPPSPVRWYSVHFHRPGLGVLPSPPV